MMSIKLKTQLKMRQLNKLESIIYLLGGIIMVIGAGLYAFLLIQPIACWLMLAGLLLFLLCSHVSDTLEHLFQFVVYVRLCHLQDGDSFLQDSLW